MCVQITWRFTKTGCNSFSKGGTEVLLFQEVSRWACWFQNILWVSEVLTVLSIPYCTHGRKTNLLTGELARIWHLFITTLLWREGPTRAEVTCWAWPHLLPSPFAAALPMSGFSFSSDRTPGQFLPVGVGNLQLGQWESHLESQWTWWGCTSETRLGIGSMKEQKSSQVNLNT